MSILATLKAYFFSSKFDAVDRLYLRMIVYCSAFGAIACAGIVLALIWVEPTQNTDIFILIAGSLLTGGFIGVFLGLIIGYACGFMMALISDVFFKRLRVRGYRVAITISTTLITSMILLPIYAIDSTNDTPRRGVGLLVVGFSILYAVYISQIVATRFLRETDLRKSKNKVTG